MRIFNYSIGSLIAVAAVMGCKKDDAAFNESVLSGEKQTISVSIAPPTKVSFTEVGTGLKLGWEGDDTLTLYKQDGSKWGDYPIDVIDQTTGMASFVGPKLEENVSYYAVYPNSSQLQLSARDEQRIGTTKQMLDGNFDHLDDVCSMKSVTFKSGENIALEHELAMMTITHTSDVDPMAIEVVCGSGDDAVSSVVTLNNGVDGNLIKDVNILLAPKAADALLTINVYSPSNQCYTFTKESTKEFVAGGHYLAPIGDYFSLATDVDATSETDVIKQRVVESLVAHNDMSVFIEELQAKLIADGNSVAAASLNSSLPPTDEQLLSKLANLQADGSWSTIDYTNQQASSWPVDDHQAYCLLMAKCYRNPASQYFKSPELLADIVTALEYWLDNNFYNSSNWYPNKVYVPRTLAHTLVLLEDVLTSDLKERCRSQVLTRSSIDMTGSNRIMLSYNVFLRALLFNVPTDLAAANNAVKAELTTVPFGTEGLQEDYSYHLHGSQMQTANYGLSFANTVAPWLAMVAGSSYQFEAEKIDMLHGFMLGILNSSIWAGQMDIHGLGRQIVPDSEIDKVISTIVPMYNMMMADNSRAADYQNVLDRNFTTPHVNDLVGNFYYDCSKYMIHRAKDYSVSLRMVTNELIGGELVNDENLEGFYLADGGMFIYYQGGEYKDVFPAWDPYKVPGVTANLSKQPNWWASEKCYLQSASFVGGVSDGEIGMAIMQYSRNSVTANKSWVFLDDKIICLGNTIGKSGSIDVVTTVEQNNYRMPFKYHNGSDVVEASLGSDVQTNKVLSSGVGYESLDDALMNVSASTQSGNWLDIATYLGDIPVTKEVFSAYFSHDTKNSYAYSIEPGVDSDYFFDADRNRGFTIVQNNSIATVVESVEDKVALFVFWAKGEVETELYGKVVAKKPSVVLMKGDTANPTIIYGTGDGGGVSTPEFSGVTNI